MEGREIKRRWGGLKVGPDGVGYLRSEEREGGVKVQGVSDCEVVCGCADDVEAVGGEGGGGGGEGQDEAGAAEEKSPTSFTYTGTEIWKERSWETRAAWSAGGGRFAASDRLRAAGRAEKESLAAEGSRRASPARKVSRPRVAALAAGGAARETRAIKKRTGTRVLDIVRSEKKKDRRRRTRRTIRD
ncbi:hypothetical protein BHE74_00005819 [Ensete ventricosum]|nr:hypothetical protein BHE74_00005819 [Ensete ventricosum]